MNINDIAITSLEVISGFDIATGAYLFTLDELQSASIANSEEKQDITGKRGRKLTSLKKNKSDKVSGTNGIVSGGLLEMQVGNTFENKATEVMWTDYLTVSKNAATTTYTAVGTAGAEIVDLYVKNSDGTLGKSLTQGSSTGAGVFTYAPGTKALAFYAGTTGDDAAPADIAEGTEIVVYYKRKIQADTLENMSDLYSKKCALYIDALGEDKCANVYRIQFYIPKADFSGEFSLEMGDNQTVHAFEAEALAGGCGAGASLWTYTIFGANAADAT